MDPLPTPNGELIPQGGGDSIPLPRSPLVVGRRESCDICLQFPNVSGKHCQLTFKEGFWVIQDLDSTNGTKVNGLRVHIKIVRNGDSVTIGKRKFLIQYTETGVPSKLDDYDAEMEEAMGMSLLEKAGLAKPEKRPRRDKVNPNEALSKSIMDDEEEEE